MGMRVLAVSLSAPCALMACHASDDLPTEPPTRVTKVTSGGFTSPSDAVASPDGRTLYFAAYDDAREPALWKTAAAAGSTADKLATGDPLAAPIGLVLSCDGATLYIADLGSGLLEMPASGGTPTVRTPENVVRPGGLAMGPDCKTIFATARTADGLPALFAITPGELAARIVWAGPPLVSPTGLHVDDQGVAWVMDHLAAGANGEGVLFAIPSDGSTADEVVSDLRMGTPGGVSLTAGGGTAVMPTLDRDGKAQLTSVDIASGDMQQLAVPDMIDPAGLRTARNAGVFAIVDSEGGAIYRAE
jgi:DNA-binding beta-propeller fold protein YncE